MGLLGRTKWAQLVPKGSKDGLLGALDGSKRGQNGLNMPRTPSQSVWDHFWTKPFFDHFRAPNCDLRRLARDPAIFRFRAALRLAGYGVLGPAPPWRGPVRGPRRALGPFSGVETTKTGELHPGQVPSETRFGPVSLRYGLFSVSMPRPLLGHKRAQNDPKRTQTGGGGGAAGCYGALIVCRAPPIRHEALRTRTDRGPPGAFLGRFGPVQSRFGTPICWGCGGAGWGDGPGPKTGFWGGHHWASPTPQLEARAGAGADFWL